MDDLAAIKEEAASGMKILKSSILNFIKLKKDEGVRNIEIVEALNLHSEYEGGSKNFLVWSVLGLLLKEGEIYYIGESKKNVTIQKKMFESDTALFDFSTRQIGSGYPPDFATHLARAFLFSGLINPDHVEIDRTTWGKVFAKLIGGRWRPSRNGLDDVLLEFAAWHALIADAKSPGEQKQVHLVRGRFSPLANIFETDEIQRADPALIGEMVLNIWNERVTGVMAKYDHLRTVVLIKSDDLLELAAFETDTVRYDSSLYDWSWNKNKNLVGHDKATGLKRFTWQPSGSQFTITEEVPKDRVALRLRQPPPLDRDKVLETIRFDESWVELLP